MVRISDNGPDWKKAQHLSSVNHTSKTIHHHHHYHHFIPQNYCKVPKTIRLNVKLYFVMKIPNRQELQQIVSNHLSNIDLKDFMKQYFRIY